MRILLGILLFGLSGSLLAQKKNCDCGDFYTGTFYIYEEGDKDTCFIYRTASSQREVEGDFDEEISIFWLDECTYVLRDRGLRTKKKIHPTDVISKIVETGDNYYKVEAKLPRKKKMLFTVYVYPPKKS